MIRHLKLCRTVATPFLLLTVVACGTATPYQPYRPEMSSGVHGGFSEERLAADRFRVRFHGNDFTSREKVEGYLLYRAAELTQQNGFTWFRIADRHTEHEIRTVEQRYPAYRPWDRPGYGQWLPQWRYYRTGGGWSVWDPYRDDVFWTDQVDVRTVESFEASADIVMGKGSPPAEDPRPFTAALVLRDLQPIIVLPQRHGQ